MKNNNICTNCGGNLNEKGICSYCGYSRFSVKYDDLEIPFDSGCASIVIGIFILPFFCIAKILILLSKKIRANGFNKNLLIGIVISFIIGILYTLIFFAISSNWYKTDQPESHTGTQNETMYSSSSSESTTHSTTTMRTHTDHALPSEVNNSYYEEFTISNGPFNKVKASSYANWSGTVGYPNWAFDGNTNRSWQDGVKNSYGVNEWLLSYNSNGSTEYISSVTIYNGFHSTSYNTASRNFYYLNSRVKDFSIEFDDGRVLSFTLSDTKSPQTFSFGETIETCFVRFKIKSVYEGDEYSDTCIGEIIYNR